jgi:hypothetical protein
MLLLALVNVTVTSTEVLVWAALCEKDRDREYDVSVEKPAASQGSNPEITKNKELNLPLMRVYPFCM